MDEHYDYKKIEEKWQKFWEEKKLNSLDFKKAERPFYNLMMFPYPSAEGLHVGNMYAFVHSDTFGRFMRLKGFDVFEPIGLDGFGIHSENYAIKQNEHILDVSKRTEKHFYEQLRLIGNQYDWTRRLETYKPEYYKWTQWIFVQMFKKDLAYQAESYVNWCLSCKTVLSDEQVISGRCERCDTLVEKKMMRQWFFKITDYAEKLLKNLEIINWSERTKAAQRNWIGKSEGAEFQMEIKGSELKIKVFTTRLDTVFGMTFALIAPEHKLIEKLKPQITNWPEVEEYIIQAQKKSEMERTELAKEKTGVELKGIRIVNPFNKKEICLFVSDFVLAYYGTGAVMAVPGHDERDYEFAKKFGLEIIEVVKSADGKSSIAENAFVDAGVLINSGGYDRLSSEEAREKLLQWLEKSGIGRKKVHYKLRDWCVSRQRYWGPPIPMIYCEKCGVVPVPEKDLPVLLPETKDYIPKNDGFSPLARNEKFVKASCPKCGGAARRETDVSDTFLDSAWYFFRYPSTEFDDRPFDKERTKKWLPVDMYIGGHEHAVLHLLYSRFMTMFFKDLGLIDFDEPYKRFFAHGLLIKEGAKISKSKGNIVNPDEYIKKFGADSIRMYLMFLGDVRLGGDWRDAGMNGMARFVKRIWKLKSKIKDSKSQIENLIHKTIKKVGDDLENLKFNTAIAALMILVNEFEKQPEIAARDFEIFAKLISPFAPHIAEELWHEIGHEKSIFAEKWPEYDKDLVKDAMIELVIQINGKVRDKILVPAGISESDAKFQALASEKIKAILTGHEPKKVIFARGRLINVVI
jgi:leucyl-tRNA synthetase